MREVAAWLRGVYGNNTGFWLNAHDGYALDNDGYIVWIDESDTEVGALFWLPSQPDHSDNGVQKNCVYLNLENPTDPGLAMENCAEGHHYPLCKI